MTMDGSIDWSLVAAIGLAVLIAACDPGADPADIEMDGWTIDEGTLTLTEDLHVSEQEDFLIGHATDVAVGSDGHVYTVDREMHHVKVLSPTGELTGTIGREGEGPGEFQRPASVAIARGDSVFVFDDAARRISVFAPETFELERTVSLTDHPPPDLFATSVLVPSEQEGFVVGYGSVIHDESTHAAVYRVDAAGRAQPDSFFTTREPTFLTDESGEVPRSMPEPFRRASFKQLGPDDRLYHTDNDSMRVDIYNLQRDHEHTIRVPFEPVPVTEKDIEHVKEQFDSEWASRMIDRADLAETKPAFDQFLVDDRHRLWFKRPTGDPDASEWWVVDSEEQRVQTARVPAQVTFTEFRDGYAYGTVEGQDHLPAVTRYAIDNELQ